MYGTLDIYTIDILDIRRDGTSSRTVSSWEKKRLSAGFKGVWAIGHIWGIRRVRRDGTSSRTASSWEKKRLCVDQTSVKRDLL